MARLGMLIDLRTCIGCHACSVACKPGNPNTMQGPYSAPAGKPA